MSCWGYDRLILWSGEGGHVDVHTIHSRGNMRSAAAAARRWLSRNCGTDDGRNGRNRIADSGICFSCRAFQYWILRRRSSTVAHSSSTRNRSRLLRYHVGRLHLRTLIPFALTISVAILTVRRSIRWWFLGAFRALWRLLWCGRPWRRHPPRRAGNVIDWNMLSSGNSQHK